MPVSVHANPTPVHQERKQDAKDRADKRARCWENIPIHSVVFLPIAPSLGAVEVRLAWRRADVQPALAALIEVARTVADDPAV